MRHGGVLRGSVLGAVLIAASSVAAAQNQSGLEGLSPLDVPQQQQPAPPSNALDKKDLEFYIRHLNVWQPHIAVEIGDFRPSKVKGLLETTVRASYKGLNREFLFYVSEDGQHVFRGDVFEVTKNPYQPNIEKITTADQPAFGKPGAPVVIAVYSDFQCPYCAKEAKILRQQVRAAYPQQVRVYFRDYPLNSHKWALDAAIAGRCIYQIEPEAFWDYHDWIFEEQAAITPENLKDKVGEFAAGQGLDALKLAPCLEKRETESVVRQSLEEGRSLGITSTPTIFVNGRKLTGSVTWPQLKQIIDYEIEYQKIAQNAGDDCACEVDAAFPSVQ